MTRPWGAIPVLLATTLVTACSSSNTPVAGTPVPSAKATPSGGGEVLFAVLERQPRSGWPDTVAIVGLDGYARVKARFASVAVPRIGNAAAILPDVAHVAAGSVFYVDHEGVVRALTPGHAQAQTVTTFPAGGPQQEVGFAVDPTGRHLIATVLTLPPLLPPSPSDCDICRGFGDQSARVDVEVADRGGSEHTVRTVMTRGDAAIGQRLNVVGWDSRGPVAALDQVLGAQSGVPGWDAHITHLDAAGRAGPLLGGGCQVQVEAHDGTVVCNDNVEDAASVRDAAGRVRLASVGLYDVLSDDGTRVAYMDTSGSHAGVIGQPLAVLPRNFNPQGFAGDDIVVGSTDPDFGELFYVRLSDPTRMVDLGFQGTFVGAVQV